MSSSKNNNISINKYLFCVVTAIISFNLDKNAGVLGSPSQGVSGAGGYGGVNPDGSRYGGTFQLAPDGSVQENHYGDAPQYAPAFPFGEPSENPAMYTPTFAPTFFNDYFKNFNTFLQEVFQNNAQNQQAALDAAQRAFQAASEQGAGMYGSEGYGFGFGPDLNGVQPGAGAGLANRGAFASGSIGPQGTHQVASVYPENPNSPNVNVHTPAGGGGPGYRSVSSSAYSSSVNMGGQAASRQGARTVINDNGKITEYKVDN